MNFYINKILEYLKENYFHIIETIILIIILVLGILTYNNTIKEEVINNIEEVKEEVIEQPTINTIKVDIKGCIKKPGVYEINDTSIINDIIKLAGGLTSKADTKTINLSKKVTNEMVIYIPSKVEAVNTTPINDATIITPSNEITPVISDPSINQSSDITPPKEETNSKININTADITTLSKLDGIGESKAQKIIDYRNTNGLFKNIEELKNVSGIGDASFAKIKDNITI